MNNPEYSFEQNPHKGNKGLTRAIRAAINSWAGLKYAVNEESAFRQELGLVFVLIPTSFFLPVSSIEHILLVIVLLLVLIVELINSGLEAAIDRISFDNHGLSKRAKDYGSAAVMLSIFIVVFSWAYILYPICKSFIVNFFAFF